MGCALFFYILLFRMLLWSWTWLATGKFYDKIFRNLNHMRSTRIRRVFFSLSFSFVFFFIFKRDRFLFSQSNWHFVGIKTIHWVETSASILKDFMTITTTWFHFLFALLVWKKNYVEIVGWFDCARFECDLLCKWWYKCESDRTTKKSRWILFQFSEFLWWISLKPSDLIKKKKQNQNWSRSSE